VLSDWFGTTNAENALVGRGNVKRCEEAKREKVSDHLSQGRQIGG
jgi:hypothetical protein